MIGNKKAILGAIGGGLVVGFGWLIHAINTHHHYSEIGTFYREKLGGSEVVGISYLDYHGVGIMELESWKVLLKRAVGDELVIYQGRADFQESSPHQPKIEIKGQRISIDDGETHLEIDVRSHH